MSTPPRHFDHSGLQILEEQECLKLLSSMPLGRLVFTQGGLPAVRLVNFVVDDRTVIFATADGDKYRAAERGDVVAFEVDDVDPERHLGWTVTAAGHLAIIDPDDAALLLTTLPVRPWAPNRDRHLIRLAIEVLEGRRLLAWGERQAR
ncbi:MAG TPA: pyridoxamine 5'-phosphate oxidase family protein [Kribbella sp.]|uniref:pyridoxamine 5'-phosphate oxidase family protein n=1 Tax=Kribbella sp. TaxID=1871183 RepID=UPI002D784A31|nr:pyridoxamine 5'-phosphate oxidase family protein [Kribbella sp.]HET6297672.1 pyridoxamine 5'-phosphate oxidase family protein [Kribbella sp.]